MDEARRSIIFAYNRHPGANDRRELRLPASFFGDTEQIDPSQAARFVRIRTESGWRVRLEHAAFPGSPALPLDIEVVWLPAATGAASRGRVTLRLQLPFGTMTFGTGADRAAATLEEWLFAPEDPKGGATEIAGMVDARFAARLASTLCGDGLDVGRAGRFRVALSREGHWSLSAEQQMRAMPGENIALEFNRIIFATLSEATGRPGQGNGAAFLLDRDPGDRPGKTQREDVRSLFGGQGAPPPPDEAAAGRRVLYCLAKDGVSASGRFEAGRSGSVAVDLRVVPPVRATPSVAWRNQGDPRPVMGCRLDMEAGVTGGANGAGRTAMPPGPTRLWRTRDVTGALRFAAALEPMADERGAFDLTTPFGSFAVCALPARAERPGAPAHVPALRLAARGVPASRTLVQFEAPLTLLGTSMVLGRAEGAFSRLAFHEAECLFVIAGVALNHSWTGAARLGPEPPQSEAVIHLGAAPDQGPAVSLALDSARLVVRRPSDLLALTFRFRDLVLERDAKTPPGSGDAPRWWILPDRRTAASAYRGEPRTEAVAPACADPPPLPTSPAAYAEGPDPRPLLIVDFPPQHVAERAFFRQFKAEPGLPPPPSPIADEDAATMRDGSPPDRCGEQDPLKRRLAARARVQGKLIVDEAGGVGLDHPFTKFAKAFEPAAKAAGVDPDQRLYVGQEFLDPKAARVARRVAYATEPDMGDPAAWTADEVAGRAAQALRMLPEVDLQPGELSELRFEIGLDPKGAAPLPEDFPYDEAAKNHPADHTAEKVEAYIGERERRKDRNDADYAAFRSFFAAKPQGLSPTVAAILAAAPKGPEPKPYTGRRSYVAYIGQLAPGERKDAISAILAEVAAYNAYASDLNADAFTTPAEARVAGPSRLAFPLRS